MFSRFDHVIRGGPKYTNFLSIWWRNVRRLEVHFQVVDISHVLEKRAKKSENHEILANFDHPANFLGGAPEILKPVLGTSFQGLLPEKFWTIIVNARYLATKRTQ